MYVMLWHYQQAKQDICWIRLLLWDMMIRLNNNNNNML
jgi:hypothetical protein